MTTISQESLELSRLLMPMLDHYGTIFLKEIQQACEKAIREGDEKKMKAIVFGSCRAAARLSAATIAMHDSALEQGIDESFIKLFRGSIADCRETVKKLQAERS